MTTNNKLGTQFFYDSLSLFVALDQASRVIFFPKQENFDKRVRAARGNNIRKKKSPKLYGTGGREGRNLLEPISGIRGEN